MAHDDSKDYASKGVAGSGLGLGIAGTALGLLNASNNGGNGILGGLFGGNCNNSWNNGGSFGARVQATYDFENERRVARLESRLEGLEVATRKDETIASLKDELVQAQLLRYIDDKTCGMMKGIPYLSPRQMADPYMGSRQVISTHPPVIDVEHGRRGCNDCDNNNWF